MIAEILIRLPEKGTSLLQVVRIAQFGSGGRGVSLGLRSLVSPVNRRIQISGNTDQELENRTGHKKRGRDEIVKIFLPLCCYQRPILFFELDSVELPKAGFEYRSDPQCLSLPISRLEHMKMQKFLVINGYLMPKLLNSWSFHSRWSFFLRVVFTLLTNKNLIQKPHFLVLQVTLENSLCDNIICVGNDISVLQQCSGSHRRDVILAVDFVFPGADVHITGKN
uniref:Uncharacterized protein n=1 Tax=Salix viminalis TaxID=40686 RepID=A0A6N2K3U6_SALVM